MADDAQVQQEFNQKVIDKLQSDPDFLGHLLQDPQATLEQAGLSLSDYAADEGPVDESEAKASEGEGGDVEGHGLYHWHYGRTYFRTCKFIEGGQGYHWR